MVHQIRNALLMTLLLTLTIASLTPARGEQSQPDISLAADPVSDPEILGMVVRDPWYEVTALPGGAFEANEKAQDRMGEILKETGVRWVRLEFIVSGGDPANLEQDLQRSFDRYDHFINEVAPNNNLKVLALLGFGMMRDRPPLAANGITSTDYISPTEQPYGGSVNEWIKMWLDRGLGFAERYREQIAAYEILNEQNRMPPNGDAVPPRPAARLHTKFYRIFKLDRNTGDNETWRASIPIIIGGLHPKGTLEPGRPGYISDINYLRALYGYGPDGEPLTGEKPFYDFEAARGFYPVDGVGYHPYPAEIPAPTLDAIDQEIGLINRQLDLVRAALRGVGHGDAPYWITEIGYDVGRVNQTEVGQAVFLRAIFSVMDARPDVARVFWFKYEDFPGDRIAPNRWGIVHIPFRLDNTCEGGACYHPGGEPDYRRPGYLTYRELAGLPNRRLFLPFTAR